MFNYTFFSKNSDSKKMLIASLTTLLKLAGSPSKCSVGSFTSFGPMQNRQIFFVFLDLSRFKDLDFFHQSSHNNSVTFDSPQGFYTPQSVVHLVPRLAMQMTTFLPYSIRLFLRDDQPFNKKPSAAVFYSLIFSEFETLGYLTNEHYPRM